MIKTILAKINFISLMFLVLFFPTGYLLTNYFGIKIYFYAFLQLSVPFLFILYIFNIINKNIKINKYDIYIYLLFFLGIITTINAIDVQTSFWGAYLRNEGLLTISSYYLIFLNTKALKKDETKKVLDTLLIVGVMQFVYSFLQVFIRGKYIFIFGNVDFNHMAIGFVGNANMLGSFCVLLLGIALGMYLLYDKKRYLFLTIIFYINLLLAQSTGPFFAFVAMFIMAMIILFIKKMINWKKIIVLISVFIPLFLIVSFGVEHYCTEVFNDQINPSYTIKGDLIDTFSLFFKKQKSDELEKESNIEVENLEITESLNSENVSLPIEQNNTPSSNYGSGRLTIWKNALQFIPKYFWFGSGIDTFGYVYAGVDPGFYIDKAHNDYLQMLITQGIFTLVTYLLFLLNLFIDSVKSKDKLALALSLGFIGYAIQAFMNISIPTVAPFYFLVCGLLANLLSKEKKA